MTEVAKRIAFLIGRHLKEELTDEERQELNVWIHESKDNLDQFEKLTNSEYLETRIREEYQYRPVEAAKAKLGQLIKYDGKPQEVSVRSMWFRFSAAAAILILIVTTTVLTLYKSHKEYPAPLAKTDIPKSDITPGTFKATLKLADGRSILLDTATNGQLAQQGATQVINKDGQLVYASGVGMKGEVLWNTLSTSRGQTYPLLLADGSRVTLNSESSIIFPVTFAGDIRQVKVTGEVFFEVAHDAHRPFRVSAGGMELQDLGTSFNVNAYPDEAAVKATVVEGSVLVKKGVQKRIIKPGQQAQVSPADIKVTEVDVDKITAWKQGFFRFKEDKLAEAMKNIARWYNIDVFFEGDAQNVEISGDINRTSNLSEVLKILSLLKVNGKIEGRKLILTTK